MVNLTKQASSPVHIENSILSAGKSELQIQNAHDTYRGMMLDSTVSGAVSFLKSVINRPFSIKYPEKVSAREKGLIDALNKSLNNMDTYSLQSIMFGFLSAIEYGCSLSEVVLKTSNNHVVFSNISPISLASVQKFRFDKGALKEVVLNPAPNDGLVEEVGTGEQVTIKGDKLMLVRVQPSQEFPLGRSLLYGAWKAYKQKSVIEELSLIGHSKSLAGVVSVSVPSEFITRYLSEPNSEEALYVEHLLQQTELLGLGKTSYVMTPSDVFEGGQRQFEVKSIEGSKPSDFELNTTLNRLNDEILLSLQSTMLSLGMSGGGSFNLADKKTALMTMFIKSIQQSIASEFRSKALKLAYQANGFSTDSLPEIVFDELEELDWDTLTTGWYRLANAGLVTPDVDLEAYLRDVGNAPKANYSRPLMAEGKNLDMEYDNFRPTGTDKQV